MDGPWPANIEITIGLMGSKSWSSKKDRNYKAARAVNKKDY
jgi:hypothetical protein